MSSINLDNKTNQDLRELYTKVAQEMYDRGIETKTAHLPEGLGDTDYPMALIWRECMFHYFGVYMTGGKSYLRMWEYMLRKFGKPMTKGGVLEFTYFDRPNDHPEEKIVDVYICHFRRMLKKIPGEPFSIETIWGTGHKLRFTEVTATLGDGVTMSEEVIRSLFSDIALSVKQDAVKASVFDEDQVDIRKELDKRSVAA